jgi:glycosyltransferase 2 family protein
LVIGERLPGNLRNFAPKQAGGGPFVNRKRARIGNGRGPNCATMLADALRPGRAFAALCAALAPGRDICYVGLALGGQARRSSDAPTAVLERGMLKGLRAAARFFNQNVGFSRLGVLLSLTIIIVAAIVLYHILRDIDLDELVDALEATDWRTLLIAALFVAAGYATLTFYDLFALRTIGRYEVPYRTAALASFTSYAVGHNVGASVFSGGAVRYRIYSAWGLSVVEVTKICFVAGLTFWLGNAAMLGLGVLFAPQQAGDIDQLPIGLNRVLAVFILILLAAYIAWVWVKPRVIGREGWSVALPGGPLTLVQILLGILDLGFCALAMYMLVPDEPHLGFIPVAVIFVAATLLGFASHAPGGLGVFDATMMVALWQFDKEDLLAGLLLFRLLYYIIPFVLSLLVLGTREIFHGRAMRRVARPAAAPLNTVGGLVREKSDMA